MGKRLIFEEICNFRDLGDLNKNSGGTTKNKRVYRSSMLFGPNDKDKDSFKTLNIRSIIDLRSPNERKRIPNPYLNIVHNYLPINLSGSVDKGRAFELSKKDNNPYFMSGRYMEYIEGGNNTLRTFFNFLLEESNFPVVFHCSAGKDRTGVLSYLILMLNDVKLEEIIVDYQVSYTYIKNEPRILKDKNFLNVYKSHPEILEQFHDLFVEKYGSVDDLLFSLNFNIKEVNQLKSIL